VQGLDGEAHRHRKQLFNSLVTDDSALELAGITAKHWHAAADRWAGRPNVVLYEEAREVICRSVCDWAGIPVDEAEYPLLARELAAMYEYATSIGPRHLYAHFARQRRDRWAADLVEQVRNAKLKVAENSVLYAVAKHRELNGQWLDARTAGVELQNILRPTVATSVWVAFAAHALHGHPKCRGLLAGADAEYAEMFAQEVRRFYPFFPAQAAVVRDDFEWHGYRFAKDTRVLLGLYATNHDSQLWDVPEEFRPERFRGWSDDAYRFVPQGGGDRESGHRCPGDRVSVEQIKVAIRLLNDEIAYDVPPQDLRIQTGKMPALPRSRFVITNVRKRTS
jgi:fatty-acid peroxygenase